MSPTASKVLLILFPGAVAYELATAAEVLAGGMTVEVATPDGGTTAMAGSRGRSRA